MNIVSLLPSTTEIIFDLGLEDQLRGVTIECNWPAEARAGREIVVDTFTKPGMTPGEIDAIVKERMTAGLDLYNLDDDALARCAPDLILSQDLCRVCAVASGDVDAAIARLRCDATLLQIDPQNLLEVIESINTIAQAAGVPHRGLALTQALHERLLAVSENVKGKTRPAVFVLEWIDPPFGAGHWVPDIINAAGGEPVLCRPGRMARNPATGEAVKVKAKTVAKISALKGFKDIALGVAPAPKLVTVRKPAAPAAKPAAKKPAAKKPVAKKKKR